MHTHSHTKVLTKQLQQICRSLSSQIKIKGELLSLLLPAISSTQIRPEINDLSFSVSVVRWPGADSQTQNTQLGEGNSTSCDGAARI